MNALKKKGGIMANLSEILLREEDKKILVTISEDKPDINSLIINKWQNIIDTLADFLHVPTSLIMKIEKNEIKVFLTGNKKENPYRKGAGDSLGHGLYCETVIGRNKLLIIPDALKLEKWKDNPDVKLNMISYLGYPLKWPDGQFFGTLCVLDNKENHYSDSYKNLMKLFKEVIELDLNRELEYYELQKKNLINERNLREIHHRIKNNFNMILSYIQLKADHINMEQNELILEIENRINAVSLIHDQLYKSKNFKGNTSEYIRKIASLVIKNLTDKNIVLHLDIEDIRNLQDLFHFGMILIELITNSIKYAFDGIKDPAISISLKRDNTMLSFIYRDNGVGIKESGTGGLGSILIESFLNHYNGKLNKYNDNGAVFDFSLIFV